MTNNVKFVLNAPMAPFLANLAMDMFAISSPKAIQDNGENYGTPAVGGVGTGPFKFVEWVEGDHITVAANDDYWGGRPKIDEIIWRVIPDDFGSLPWRLNRAIFMALSRQSSKI